MIEVFKIVHNYYDPGASVKFKSNPFGITRGNKLKLQKFTCHYNILTCQAGPRVCLSGLALGFNCWTV